MIISECFWKSNANQIVNVSVALGWAKVAPRLEETWHNFFIPLFGEEVCQYLIDKSEEEDPTPSQKNCILFARKALANLMLWSHFDEMNVRVTDQGFQRQESDTFKTLYKYQSDALRQNYKNTGFNALETTIIRLESLIGDLDIWKSSPCHTKRKKRIVQTMEEVNRVFDIHSSFIIFLALEKDIEMIERTRVPSILGHSLYEKLMENIESGENTIGQTTTDELRLRTGEIVSLMAVCRFIERTGSITDRGFYFLTYKPETGNNEQKTPVSNSTKSVTVQQIQRDIQSLISALDIFIDSYLPDLRDGKPSKALSRDNNRKRTYFA